MSIDVLCVGHAAYDLSVYVDEFPAEDSKCETQELLESGGGPAANAAYLLSSWGVPSAFAGVVGDDVYGRRIRDEFQSIGADLSWLELRPGHVTPLSVILINKQSGSRTIINRKQKTAPLQLDASSIASVSPRVLLFDGHELEGALAAMRAFPEAISILDAGSWRDGTAALAGEVDYLAASKRFALQASDIPALATDVDRRNCIEKLRARYSANTIVTLGEDGLIADDGTGFQYLPAFPTTPVDTTAAGDIFHGALAYAFLNAMSFQESLRFSSMAASLSVRAAGGRTSIPALAAVKGALNTHAEGLAGRNVPEAG